MNEYTILFYEIYICPTVPTANGVYYGKTPILEQAQEVMKLAKENGQSLLIKAVCSDGKRRYL